MSCDMFGFLTEGMVFLHRACLPSVLLKKQCVWGYVCFVELGHGLFFIGLPNRAKFVDRIKKVYGFRALPPENITLEPEPFFLRSQSSMKPRAPVPSKGRSSQRYTI